MYNQVGVNEFKLPRLTHAVAEQLIASYLRLPRECLRFSKLPEEPTVWRHACVPTGVIVLPVGVLPHGDKAVTFSYCASCAKAVYYFDK